MNHLLRFSSQNNARFVSAIQELNSDYTLLPVNATLHSASMRLDPNPIRTALKMCGNHTQLIIKY